MIQNDVLDTAKLEGRLEGKLEGRLEGIKEGIKEGEAKGLKKGKIEGKTEIAHNLKKMGLSIEMIIQATGLSAEEIESL